MQLNCPSCGSGDTRRAHRRLFDRLLSLFNRFPCWCGECGARFFALAGRDEHRKRRLLRDLASESPVSPSSPPAPQPEMLITVRTVARVADLLALLNQINLIERTPSVPIEASPPSATNEVLAAPSELEVH